MARPAPLVQRNIYVFDSGTHEELPEHRLYAVSYEPFWQSVRMGLAFKMYDDTVHSITVMDAYIALEDPGHFQKCAIWRCYNQVTSIPHGQVDVRTGIHMVEPRASETLRAYETSLIERIREMGQPEYWDWNYTRSVLLKMCIAGKQSQIKLIRNKLMQQRGYKKEVKLELRYFFDVIDNVMIDLGGANGPASASASESSANGGS